MPNTGSLEGGRIRLGLRVDLKPVPFPSDRVLHWVPKFRNGESDEPTPIPALISQEILTAINSHVSQSLDREIGGFLLGDRCQDPNTGQEYVTINQYVEARATEASSVSLTFTPDSWHLLDEEMSGKYSGKLLVGWYHSHPRMDVFLSPYDLQIHRDRFTDPWKVALVMEPQKRHGGFFYWRNAVIDEFRYGEFYEYLSVEAARTRESVSSWVNYVCRDLATGEYYEPLRKPVQPPPLPHDAEAINPAQDRSKSRTYLLIAAMAVIVMLAGGLTYYFMRLRQMPEVAIPSGTGSTDTASDKPQVPTDVFELLNRTDFDVVPLDRVTTQVVVDTNQGRKNAKKILTMPTGDLKFTLFVNDLGMSSAQAKAILKDHLVAQVENKNAVVEVRTKGTKLEIYLTARLTDFLRKIDQSAPTEYAINLTFLDNRASNNPWELKYSLTTNQVIDLKEKGKTVGRIVGPENKANGLAKEKRPVPPKIDVSTVVTPNTEPKVADPTVISPTSISPPLGGPPPPKPEDSPGQVEPIKPPVTATNKGTGTPPVVERPVRPSPAPPPLLSLPEQELEKIRKEDPPRVEREAASLERKAEELEQERQRLKKEQENKPKEERKGLERERERLKKEVESLKKGAKTLREGKKKKRFLGIF